MNEFHVFVKTSAFVCLYFYILIFLFVGFTQFTLLLYKSLMVVENFQKYHWIQHTYTQPSYNEKVKQIIMNERSE